MFDMYCVPSHMEEVTNKFLFSSGPLSGASEEILAAGHGAYEAKFVLLFVAFVVLVLSFGFLYVLTFFVELVIGVIIAVVFLGLLILGCYFTFAAFSPSRNILHHLIPEHAFVMSLSL